MSDIVSADLAWPEAFRALFLQGVELVIVPSYWVADDITDAGMKHDAELVSALVSCGILVLG